MQNQTGKAARSEDRGFGEANQAGKQQDQSNADSREQSLDKTLEDSFPASDPPSTDPNPGRARN